MQRGITKGCILTRTGNAHPQRAISRTRSKSSNQSIMILLLVSELEAPTAHHADRRRQQSTLVCRKDIRCPLNCRQGPPEAKDHPKPRTKREPRATRSQGPPEVALRENQPDATASEPWLLVNPNVIDHVLSRELGVCPDGSNKPSPDR